MIYLLDTNAIADLMRDNETVRGHRDAVLRDGEIIGICQPVYFETLRGLLWVGATRQQQALDEIIVPELEWIPLVDADWRQAAAFWAEARKGGKQLSDVDLLIAAMTLRLDGILVSDDDDFDALPMKRENWRKLLSEEDHE
jgi:predicted nucleic acid-binding protein